MLVEGRSDQRALEALAARRGRDLAAERISIVPIGGAQAIGRYLARFGPHGSNVKLAGLCDAAEEGDFRRALERAGLGANLTRAGMEELDSSCAWKTSSTSSSPAGAAAVEGVIAAEGELGSFRTFQKQPAKRALPYEEQLWRFMWNRKARDAPLLVTAALDLGRVPRPLDGVLAHVTR